MAISPLRKYNHIFFDLDHTLWDFEGNSRHTLTDLYAEFKLGNFGIKSSEEFITEYERINTALWEMYRKGGIDKPALRNTRFNRVLAHWDVEHDDLAFEINERYLIDGPKKTGLLPNALETLNYLKEKYHLHLITNGFKEVQHTKLHGSGLHIFFAQITTSEETGYLKPDPRVFEIALDSAGAAKEESLYVGDHYETDVVGGRRAGIDQVFFNPKEHEAEEPATFEIRDLIELKVIL